MCGWFSNAQSPPAVGAESPKYLYLMLFGKHICASGKAFCFLDACRPFHLVLHIKHVLQKCWKNFFWRIFRHEYQPSSTKTCLHVALPLERSSSSLFCHICLSMKTNYVWSNATEYPNRIPKLKIWRYSSISVISFFCFYIKVLFGVLLQMSRFCKDRNQTKNSYSYCNMHIPFGLMRQNTQTEYPN